VSTNGGSDGGAGVDGTSSIVQRDEVALTNGSCGSFPGTWTNVTLTGGNDTTVASGTCYRYRELLSDNVGNQGTSGASNVAKVDTSAPSIPSLAFSNLSANAYWDGSGTLYFRPSAGGTFTVTATSTDAQSGVASYAFGSLNSNGGSNWSGTQTGDHVDYTFNATTTAPSSAPTVNATNAAGSTSADATYSIAADATGPSVTAPTVVPGYYTSLSVPVSTNSGSDGGAGVDNTTSILQRDDAPLNNGSCGSFSGTWTTVTLSGGNDTGVANGRCYEYRERLSDRVGNQGTSPVSAVAKVDVQAPSNSIGLSNVSPAGSASKSGTIVYYRGAVAGGGSFKLTNAVSDGESGAQSSATAALGGGAVGWSHTPSIVSTPAGGPFDSNAFSWNQGTSSSPTETVTGADTAGNTTGTTLTFTDDSTAPTGGALTVNGAAASGAGTSSYSSSGSFPVDARTDYAEAQSPTASGLSSSTLTRAAATLTNNACGTFGAPTTIPGTPNQSGLATGCYEYTLTGTDNVGNAVAIRTTVKVDTDNPSVSLANPGTPLAGTVSLGASASDGTTSVAQVAFERSPAGAGTWTTISTDSSAPFSASWNTGSVSDGLYDLRAVATDAAGNTSVDVVTNREVDNTAPQTTIDSSPADPSNNATPSFSFSSNEAGSTFQCRIDGGSWTSCTSPDTISPALAEGSHTFDVRATDAAGNTDASPATTTWTVDLTAPVTSLGSGPGSPSNITTPSFTFSSNEPGSIFQCRIDGGGWSACSSPYTVAPALAEGTHTFDVRAIDPAGNADATPASQTWTIDVTAPNTTIDSAPNNPSNNTTPTFAFSASEPGSTFECRIDGGSWTPCTSPDTISPPLGAGSHTFDVRATDLAGNTDGTPAGSTWTIDLTPPNTTIDSTPPSMSNNATPTFAFSSNEAGSTFQCRMDGGSWTPCTSPDTISPALTEGSHTFDVRAIDPAGNTDGSPASYSWVIDLGPPSVTITAPTTYINSSDPSTFSVTATTPDTDVTHVDFYECSNASTGCSTGTWSQFDTDSSAPYSGSWTTPSSDGIRSIRAVAVDAANNTGADIRTITIDRTAPSGVTVSYPNGYVTGSFAITTSNGPDADVDGSTATLERQTGNLAADSCSSYSAWTAASSPDTVATGHCAVYRFRVADNAGNWATATSPNEVKSDTNAPSSAQDDPGANLRQTVTLTSTASDTGGSGLASVTFQRRPSGGGSWTTIAGDTTSPYSTAFDTTTVSDGLYDFRTVATDVAGNVETAPAVVASRRIDNTAPSATMLSPGNPVRGIVGLTSTTSDSGSGVNTVTYELAPHTGSFNTQPASWDTTLGADGLYDLRVTATDVAGNSTTSALVTTRVDNTAPALTFSSPASGANVKGTVPLVASSSDASPASPPISFAYKLHSDPPSMYAPTGASWDTTSLPAGDGLYDLRAQATDDASNTTTVVNTSILVDNVPPSVSITAPAAAINGSLPSPTSFSATAGDPGGSGVQQVQFFECSDQSNDCSTGVWSPLGTVPAPGPYTVSWNIPGTDGNHALAVVATDNAGHSSSAIRNVSVDRTAPDTTIVTKPADPSSAASPTFTFTSSESGSTFECRIDGSSWTPCTTPDSLSGLSDNSHTFDVRATDAAGNTDPSPDTWTWHRDTNNPTATMNNPGANIRQTVTLTSSESDPAANGYASGLASVSYEYSANGSTWAAIGTVSSAPFDTMPWDTTGIADGVYQLRIVAHDVAGNATASTAVTNVRIDNTVPTTSQNDPGQYLRATQTLTGSAADTGSGVDHVDFQVAAAGSGSWSTVGTDTTPGNGIQVSFDTTSVADGRYDFRTVAFDLAGNQAASAPVTNKLVDNTAPTATLNDPGAYLRGAVTLTSSTSDPGGANASGIATVAYEYTTNGGSSWQSTGSTFDSTSVADGNVQLHVVATDAAGNTTTSAPLTKLVDNTKPSTTDNAPSGWQSSPVTVTLSPSDAGSGVNVTEYSIDGNPSYTVGTSVTIPAPSDGSNDGTHTIAYFSVDNAGNIENVRSATVLIDATPPACGSCSAADYLRGTVALSANPTAGGSGIQSVAFEYSPASAGTWTTIGTDTTAPYGVNWDTTSVADGHYDLRIVVTDNASNVTTTDLPDKVVDNTAPNVAVVGSPTEGQNVSGTLSIDASAADVTSPVASVRFIVRGNDLGTDTTAPFSLNWDTTTGPDGAATIQIIVTDMAGNSTTSAVRNVTVDNVAPTPVLSDPGSNLAGTVSLSATSDPDTVQVDFERRAAGGGSWITIASDTTLPWGTSLDTTTLADGLYDFRAVATDGAGHTAASPIRSGVRVDNTLPSGTITAPAAGATTGGSSVTLSATVADGGSGVASVRYELRPTGGGAFTQIASSSSAPFGATWDATTVSTGSYDLRPVVTDAAGNTFTGPVVTFTVDVTAPTVTLTNPGATVAGIVTLNATVTGSGAQNVVFGATPTGGASWTYIGTDTTSPWSTAFDTTKLTDGVYDVRATVTDSLGNTSQDVVTGIRIDNTPPQIVSTSPAEGATIGSANAISFDTNEAITPTGVTLDGAATVTPVVSGMHVDYNTGALGLGPHTLAGVLQDAAGKTTPFRIHFSIYTSGTPPYVEKNTSRFAATTLDSTDGFAAATMPSGAWPASGNDWIVVRVAPMPAPTGLTNGFGPGPEVIDVSARWALTGVQLHQFAQPLDILIRSSLTGGLVPATYDGAAWRVLHRVPAGTLPLGWNDGFYTDGNGVHVLTKHLSLFGLLKDEEAPQAPQNVRGYTGPNGLTIRWLPGEDNSGTYDFVTLFSDSSDTGHFDPDNTAANVADWKPGDNRIFRLQETDLAGNESDLTSPLVQLPSLIGMTVDQAEATLAKLGLSLGTVTIGGVGAAGTITGPEGLALAPQGAAIDVTVAPAGATASFAFKVVTAPKFRPVVRKRLNALVLLTRPARVIGQLYSPRNVRLFTWRANVRAGQSILRLRLPRQVRRPGIYSIRWTARAAGETVSRTIRVRAYAKRPPRQRTQIVLAGVAAKSVSARIARGNRVAVDGVEPIYDATANRNRDVRVIVVDVDEFGVQMVHDLHMVFPSVKIVALAAGRKTMRASLKAGARVALPRATPAAPLAKVIRKLAKR
jgi:hypothetical protein